MADVQVQFMHPTDGRLITVTVDDTMTAKEAIGELLSNDFMPPNPNGYNLAIKGGTQLRENETFAEAGVTDGKTLRVIPATEAGTEFRRI